MSNAGTADLEARRAVYGNRARLRSAAFKLRVEKVERSFEHNLDRGGMRHTWLRGWENVQKSYLMQVAAYNLGLVMRACRPQRRPAAVDAARTRQIATPLRGEAAVALTSPPLGLFNRRLETPPRARRFDICHRFRRSPETRRLAQGA
jgi:hypothetical protein